MLTLNKTHDDQAPVITMRFESGDYEGKQYRGNVAICDNPVCVCNTVDLTVAEEGAPIKESFPVAINFIEKTINDNRKSQHAAFDKTLLDNMTDCDWQLMYDLYISAKTAYTHAANLEEIDTYFPVEEIENDSPLIALGEILPFCEEMTIDVKGETYWLDDQYCIKPHCDCQEAAISFVPTDHSCESAPRTVPTIMFAYNKSHWSTLDAGGYRKGAIKCLASEIDNDGIREKLRIRHEKIRLLYTMYKEKHGIDQLRQPVRAKKRVGRNDPCPCGSGQKYKRCCLDKVPSLDIDSVNQKK